MLHAREAEAWRVRVRVRVRARARVRVSGQREGCVAVVRIGSPLPLVRLHLPNAVRLHLPSPRDRIAPSMSRVPPSKP